MRVSVLPLRSAGLKGSAAGGSAVTEVVEDQPVLSNITSQMVDSHPLLNARKQTSSAGVASGCESPGASDKFREFVSGSGRPWVFARGEESTNALSCGYVHIGPDRF